jgi:hypothetical protein
MNLDQMWQEMHLTLLTTKLDNALRKKAKQLGLDEDVYAKEHLEPVFNDVVQNLPKTTAEKLKLFEKAVGKEQFALLANSPALPTLLEDHFKDVKRQRVQMLREKLMTFFEGDEDVSPKDINELIEMLG